MDKQMTISAFSDELAQVRTKKKEFLSQIERIVPWKEWLAMIQPCYYKGERGNKPYPLEIIFHVQRGSQISPKTTDLYSDASMLPRSTHAASNICFSKPMLAVLSAIAHISLTVCCIWYGCSLL